MSTAAAETWQQSVVGLFREACVVPDTPTAMMAAGEKLASARDWKLDQEKSGRTSFIFMHQPPDPNGKPFFVTKIWDFSLPAAASIKAMILITGPEYPDVRYSICGFVMPGNVAEESASEIQRIFGPSVIASSRTKPTPNVKRDWLLSQDGKTAESCKKGISVSSYSPQTETMLLFLEMHFPDSWGAISQTNFC